MSYSIACTEEYVSESPSGPEGEVLEFRLIYQGGLKAGSGREGRAEEKHRIRRQFHGQLKELWRDDPRLSVQLNPVLTKNEGDIPRSIVDLKASDYERCGYRFLPLIRKEDGFTCSLDILFLRRDIPGNLVRSGGDIDNRLKVLIDALRMPENCSELRGCSPAPDENPFFCLLEDDDLVTGITVTTDRLLRPRHEAEHIHDVCLVIHVNTKTTDYPNIPIIKGWSI